MTRLGYGAMARTGMTMRGMSEQTAARQQTKAPPAIELGIGLVLTLIGVAILGESTVLAALALVVGLPMALFGVIAMAVEHAIERTR